MATLSTTITESVTLNGAERGSEITLEIAGVTEVMHRIVKCPADQDTTIAVFKGNASEADGALELSNVQYSRLTNLDSTNSINLSLQVETGEDAAADASASLLVAAGRSFIMGSPDSGVAVSDANATIVSSLNDLESLLIDPGSNTITVEVFIAS